MKVKNKKFGINILFDSGKVRRAFVSEDFYTSDKLVWKISFRH